MSYLCNAFERDIKATGYSAVGSVPGLGPGGRVFESHCPDQKVKRGRSPTGDKIRSPMTLNSIFFRAFSSAGSEHLPYKQRVGGSNPSTPTKRLVIQSLFCLHIFPFINYS